MTQMNPRRPHFTHPPILEQAITIVFEPLPDFSIVDVGLFWSKLSREFPEVETAPRVETLVEMFEGVEAHVKLTMVPPVQLPRTVMRSPTGEVIQFQEDRFTFNWIKPEGGEYPRFDRTLPRFRELYDKFCAYLRSRRQAPPTALQCEVTNVNIVPVKDFGADFSDFGKAFTIPSIDLEVDGLEEETFVRKRQHRIVDKEGMPLGRLHISLAPVYRTTDHEKAFQLELTARSVPATGKPDEIEQFFHVAHDMINAAFVRTVTPKMRKLWGEYNGK